MTAMIQSNRSEHLRDCVHSWRVDSLARLRADANSNGVASRRRCANVGIDQKMGAQVPLDLPFADEVRDGRSRCANISGSR